MWDLDESCFRLMEEEVLHRYMVALWSLDDREVEVHSHWHWHWVFVFWLEVVHLMVDQFQPSSCFAGAPLKRCSFPMTRGSGYAVNGPAEVTLLVSLSIYCSGEGLNLY